jgi:hypothetical protein
MVELYLHSPTHLHGLVLNNLNAGITLPYLYDYYGFDKMISVKMSISRANKVKGQVIIFVTHKCKHKNAKTISQNITTS